MKLALLVSCILIDFGQSAQRSLVIGNNNFQAGNSNLIKGNLNWNIGSKSKVQGNNNRVVGVGHNLKGDNIHMFGPNAHPFFINGGNTHDLPNGYSPFKNQFPRRVSRFSSAMPNPGLLAKKGFFDQKFGTNKEIHQISPVQGHKKSVKTQNAQNSLVKQENKQQIVKQTAQKKQQEEPGKKCEEQKKVAQQCQHQRSSKKSGRAQSRRRRHRGRSVRKH